MFYMPDVILAHPQVNYYITFPVDDPEVSGTFTKFYVKLDLQYILS